MVYPGEAQLEGEDGCSVPKLATLAEQPGADDGEDPLVAWDRLNRLVSQLQLTNQQFGHVLDRLAAGVEAQRPEVRR
jgi:hypothetical protein